MKRLACLLVVAAGCSSGFETGEAMLTSIDPAVKSASANSFTQADGNGTMVLGWTIDFFSQGAGADCMADDVQPIASIGIFTNQPPDGAKKAMLQDNTDVVIVLDSPPKVSGNTAATMGVDGISSIAGEVIITNFHLRTDLTADRIEGTVNAGGTDKNGTAVAITGSFKAPVCE